MDLDLFFFNGKCFFFFFCASGSCMRPTDTHSVLGIVSCLCALGAFGVKFLSVETMPESTGKQLMIFWSILIEER